MLMSAHSGRMRRRPTAFTLVDVVITLAIVVTVAAMAAPRYSASLTRYRAELAARRIVADLDLLRMRARAQGTYETTTFYADGDYYHCVSDPGVDDPAQEYRVYLHEAPYQADIVEAGFDSGTKNYMRYGHYGHPYWGGYVVVRVGDEKRKVVVDPDSGEATIE